MASRIALAHLGLGLLVGLLGACLEEGSSDTPQPCGTAAEGCNDREHCDRVAAPPRCVCDEGYAGANCDECALGYTASGGSCVAQPIDCRDSPCGSRGDCTSSRDGDDVCVCNEEYIGQRCANCADGFQDHDRDGLCAAACGVADLACTGRRVCSDATGTALCLCENGYVGETCSECAEGYRELPSAHACVPTCEAAEIDCSEFATCVEQASGAVCECLPGWGGENCDECTLGYSETSTGDCAAPIPVGTTFLTLVEQLDRQLLAALTAPSWELKALVPIQGALADLAWNTDEERLYGVSADGLVIVSTSTGELTTVTTSRTLAAEALTYDPERQLLYAGSASEIVSIDPASGEIDTVVDLGAQALTYDPEDDRLLALEWVGGAATPVRFDIDLDAMSVTQRGPIADTRPMIDVAIAVDLAIERPYLAGAVVATPTEALAKYCQRVATAVGSDASGSTVAGTYGENAAPGETLVLDDSGLDPRLLVYGSEGNAADDPATLEVATAHPDAIVCIVTREQPLRILVDEDARFRALVLVTETNNVELVVPDAYQATSATPIHVHVQGGSASLSVPEELGFLYDDDTWEALGVGYFSAEATTEATPTFVLLDWNSGAGVTKNLSSPPLVGALASYQEGD